MMLDEIRFDHTLSIGLIENREIFLIPLKGLSHSNRMSDDSGGGTDGHKGRKRQIIYHNKTYVICCFYVIF